MVTFGDHNVKRLELQPAFPHQAQAPSEAGRSPVLQEMFIT